MSVEYILYNKPLSRRALLEQTDLRIEHHNGSDWIIDAADSNIRIKSQHDDDIYELENHGFKDVHYIMDTIVSKFNITFYTDNLLDSYYHYQHLGYEKFPYRYMIDSNYQFDFHTGVIEEMQHYGDYEVLDPIKGIVIIPTR